MPINKATSSSIQEFLADNESWIIKDGKLYREFIFENFIEAFAFMTKVALIAERVNHHPEWSNIYSTVKVELTTHEAGGISELDFELAKSMMRVYVAEN